MSNLMSSVLAGLFLIAIIVMVLVGYEIYRKNLHVWLWSYLVRPRWSRPEGRTTHIMFAFCDHFEPRWGNANYRSEVERVERWCREYPVLARQHRDADGCFPKHSFFYPEEEYRKEHLEKIASLCQQGFGEVEIHLHHDRDTAEGLSQKIRGFLASLDRNHALVARDQSSGDYRFAFIHGNWALDNSRRDGRWCGINNELAVLSGLGCYADFTLPSAPSDTQTSKINSIYYARGRDGCSKSHDTGVDVEVGTEKSGDLMIIQGPLCLNWKNRKFGVFPRIENSDIRASAPPTTQRVDLWVQTGIHVRGKPEWVFVKIHTHGTQEGDIDTLLGEKVGEMFSFLERKYNDGTDYQLHYVSAREMYNIVKAAEAGKEGNPGMYRNFEIPIPENLGKPSADASTSG